MNVYFLYCVCVLLRVFELKRNVHRLDCSRMIRRPFYVFFLIAVQLLYFSSLKANNEEFELLSRDAKIYYFFFPGGTLCQCIKTLISYYCFLFENVLYAVNTHDLCIPNMSNKFS